MTQIDITPDVSLVKKAGEVNYKLPQALAELADNSIDARIVGQRLNVEVRLSQKGGEKHIVVSDDGQGMNQNEAARAMVMAYSTKGKGAIGEFGLGMKTACSNLGARFEIVTCRAENETATRLVYDEEEFIARGDWTLELEEVEKPFPHGTRITIRKLKVGLYAGSKDVILDKFGKLFKHFIAAGEVDLVVNDAPAEPHIPDTLREHDTEIAFDVSGKQVRGWASLLRHASPKGGYGFDLVRHNRVVAEHEKLGFAAQAGLARLVGELHLDAFLVVNNKTDFRRDTEEWDLMVSELNEHFLVDLKREARRLAHPGKFAAKEQAEVEDYIDEVQKALKSEDLQQDLNRRALDADLAEDLVEGPLPFAVGGAEEDGQPISEGSAAGRREVGEHDATETEHPPRHNGKSGQREPSVLDQHRLNRVKTQLRNLRIEHQIARLGRGSLYKIWDVEGVGTNKKLVVTTNQDHPLFAAIEDGFMLWVKHNIVEAVAEFFTEATGKTEAMLLVKSDILKRVSAMTLEVMDEPTYPDTNSLLDSLS